MDFLIDEFIKKYKSQEGIAGLSHDELETYIANEIINENGTVLITIPEAKYYNHNVREAIYRYRSKNKENYNQKCKDYYHKKMEDPEARRFHNARCREYNRKLRARKKKMIAYDEPPDTNMTFS
jgi:hypothetical protein